MSCVNSGGNQIKFPSMNENRSEEHYSFPVISIHADNLKGPVPLASGLFRVNSDRLLHSWKVFGLHFDLNPIPIILFLTPHPIVPLYLDLFSQAKFGLQFGTVC
mmetsp:Transcript_101400/g.205846  ORF Transcript_101400/g.205846 Transcript_101400/m.205846 type:complete len:104 (-) Transcript_101400:333-644(-)